MKRKIIFSAFVLVSFFMIFYAQQITEFLGLVFYQGKDNGIFRRIESTVIMSSLFFLFMSKKNHIVSMIIGFMIGIISIVLSVAVFIFNGSDLLFHTASFIIFATLFFLIEKLDKNQTKFIS